MVAHKRAPGTTDTMPGTGLLRVRCPARESYFNYDAPETPERHAVLRFSCDVPAHLAYQANWLTLNIGSRTYGLSRYRIYDPELGIFLSRDFLNYPNKYRAWSNNPVGEVDKNGLFDESKLVGMSDFRRQKELENALAAMDWQINAAKDVLDARKNNLANAREEPTRKEIQKWIRQAEDELKKLYAEKAQIQRLLQANPLWQKEQSAQKAAESAKAAKVANPTAVSQSGTAITPPAPSTSKSSWTEEEVCQAALVKIEVDKLSLGTSSCVDCTDAVYNVVVKLQAEGKIPLLGVVKWRWPASFQNVRIAHSAVVIYPKRINNPRTSGVVVDKWYLSLAGLYPLSRFKGGFSYLHSNDWLWIFIDPVPYDENIKPVEDPEPGEGKTYRQDDVPDLMEKKAFEAEQKARADVEKKNVPEPLKE